jgi:hypothetical protein
MAEGEEAPNPALHAEGNVPEPAGGDQQTNATGGKTDAGNNRDTPDAADQQKVAAVGSTAGTGGGIKQLNLPSETITDAPLSKVSEIPFTPTQRAGYNLSRFILFIICGCLLLLFIVLLTQKLDASTNITLPNATLKDTLFNQQLQVIKSLQEDKKSYRDFIMQIAQMVLLNLLLPTLTAVLGYIFGSKESATTTSSTKQ